VQVNRAICLYSANCFGDIPPKVAVLNIAKAQIVISPLFHELRGTRSKAPDDYSGKLNNIRVVFHETQYSAILKPWPLIYRKGYGPGDSKRPSSALVRCGGWYRGPGKFGSADEPGGPVARSGIGLQ
jgi:hypothetical protein